MPDQATALRRLARDTGPATTTPAPLRESSPREAPHRPVREPSSPDLTIFPRETGKPRASVIAVTSGKGGVGKSNVAVNLAVRFAASGKRVLLLDGDLGLANADVLAGVEVPYNLSHVLARRRTIREVVVRTPAGFDLVGGASGLSRMADLDDAGRKILLSALLELEKSADVILIDTGAGISSNVISFCRAADQVLVVTTPEPTAVTDAYAMVKTITSGPASGSPVLAGGGGAGGGDRRISLLVNQAANAQEARAVYDRVSRVARQFLAVNLLDAGHVLMDDEMTRAVRRRVPLVLHAPDSPASRCLKQLAVRLEQGVVPDNSPGFFRRLFRRSKGRA